MQKRKLGKICNAGRDHQRLQFGPLLLQALTLTSLKARKLNGSDYAHPISRDWGFTYHRPAR
jgi:hypothetical protein